MPTIGPSPVEGPPVVPLPVTPVPWEVGFRELRTVPELLVVADDPLEPAGGQSALLERLFFC